MKSTLISVSLLISLTLGGFVSTTYAQDRSSAPAQPASVKAANSSTGADSQEQKPIGDLRAALSAKNRLAADPSKSSKPSEAIKPMEKQRANTYMYLGDLAYWAGAGMDLASSAGQREANPVFLGSDGKFQAGKNLAFKGGLFAALKILDWKYQKPSERKALFITKMLIGAGFGALAARNFSVR